jgi:hypothetical protein
LVRIREEVSNNPRFSMIASGGYNKGTLCDSVLGIRFLEEIINTFPTILAVGCDYLTPLTFPRYMH